jgi:hypothetical protein
MKPNTPRITRTRTGVVVEVVGVNQAVPGRQRTPAEILNWMIGRAMFLGQPLPDGYVPPPGVDIAELLKQLPERYRPKPD